MTNISEFRSQRMVALYITTQHTYSLIFAGPEYQYLYADVRSNGRVNDPAIWNKSSLLNGIQDGSVKLPNDEKLSSGKINSPVFLGDDCFTLKCFMMNPISKV